MALHASFGRCVYRSIRRNITTSIISLKNNIHDSTLTIDSVDDFTTQLLQKKIEKWSTRKNVSNVILDVTADRNSKDNISCLKPERIDSLFQEAIDNNSNIRILELVEQCIVYEICPSVSNILNSLAICSQSGNTKTIRDMQKLCKQNCPEVLVINSNFQHYIAEAIWVKGNTVEALNLFKEVYRENTYLRRRIKIMLKNLVVDIVKNRSEVVLINIIKFSEDLAKEFKDFYPLSCIWQTCFLSEWFTDQCLALDLLTKYNELGKAVINRIPYVVAISLHNHRTEVVYRLLEILLKFDMKLQYTGVMLSLLDYQILQKDIRRCVEIVKWSEQANIQLLPIQHQKYLKLLINYSDDQLSKRPMLIKPPRTKTHFKF